MQSVLIFHSTDISLIPGAAFSLCRKRGAGLGRAPWVRVVEAGRLAMAELAGVGKLTFLGSVPSGSCQSLC